jgi:signal transduction histidine kinase
MADRDRLMQVLINLLSNAVKYCSPGVGRVEIRVAVSRGAVRVDVEDNGPGISRADHERIFEKFRRAGDSLTRKPGGTGLGLPISRRIIEHFGGRLWVESEPGRGAVFSFVLPLEAAAEVVDREPARAAE